MPRRPEIAAERGDLAAGDADIAVPGVAGCHDLGVADDEIEIVAHAAFLAVPVQTKIFSRKRRVRSSRGCPKSASGAPVSTMRP